ncbi:MAG: riboflavin kinase, partial [Zavarzinella sp.]|nr:riboflavin kinase [Zavarzinella sp.]
NATFGELARTVEVHLIDFAGDLYGQELGVDFVAHLRGTRKFESVDALVEQMHRDVAEAKRILGYRNSS